MITVIIKTTYLALTVCPELSKQLVSIYSSNSHDSPYEVSVLCIPRFTEAEWPV